MPLTPFDRLRLWVEQQESKGVSLRSMLLGLKDQPDLPLALPESDGKCWTTLSALIELFYFLRGERYALRHFVLDGEPQSMPKPSLHGKLKPAPNYKAILEQLFTELDTETNHTHRLQIAKDGALRCGMNQAEATAYLRGLTDAHNGARRVVARFAERVPTDEVEIEPAP